MARHYTIISQSKITYPKFRMFKILYNIRAKTHDKTIWSESFKELLSEFFKHELYNSSYDEVKVGLKMFTSSMTSPLCVEFLSRKILTSDLVMSRLYKINQSNSFVNISEFTLDLTFFKPK